ncbi:MAG: flavohemoglobin expression-modulating QEGLA motif protein, partial [Marinilabiliales bacterium]
MQTLKVNDIIKNINDELVFEASTPDNEFHIKIESYVPYICTAIHNGENLRKELQEKIALNKKERWYEEDPYTGSFISSMPIVLIGNDSRYEYDLNRSKEECIYELAWGKAVWNKNPTAKEKKISLEKHNAFYKILQTLLKKLESKFNASLVFDIHSFNYKRYNRLLPVFNIGTG